MRITTRHLNTSTPIHMTMVTTCTGTQTCQPGNTATRIATSPCAICIHTCQMHITCTRTDTLVWRHLYTLPPTHRTWGFDPLYMEILILIALILINGVFSMSKIALVTARKTRL